MAEEIINVGEIRSKHLGKKIYITGYFYEKGAIKIVPYEYECLNCGNKIHSCLKPKHRRCLSCGSINKFRMIGTRDIVEIKLRSVDDIINKKYFLVGILEGNMVGINFSKEVILKFEGIPFLRDGNIRVIINEFVR